MSTSPALRRTVNPGGPAARHSLAALLTAVWAGELIRPSKFLILAATELHDGPALDNRAGGFSGLEPAWGERVIRVSDVLLRVLKHGGEVWALTRRRADGPNLFLARLRARAAENGLSLRLRTAEPEALPAAGLYGDGFTLTGVFALAETGPDFAGEGIVFEPECAADRRSKLRATFEGLLT